MPKFTHRATDLPGANPKTDRVVICDGITIGRVIQIENGPAADDWLWSGLWVGDDNKGRSASLAEALEAIKVRAIPKNLRNLPPRYTDRLGMR